MIADSVAGLPLELRNGPDRKDSKKLPLSPLLEQPYAEISRRDWWVQFMWSLALRGNFYGRIIERDSLNLPVQIKPIHNDSVQIWRDRRDGQLRYRFYGELIPLKDVVHSRYQSFAGEVIGLNPIQMLALTFGNAIAKERFVESFYLNSANPMGVIQVPGYLDRTETRKMLRGWIAAHQGLNNANLPAILTEGAEFKPITISPSDSQLIEALNFSDSQICGRVFRVPPHMIGINEHVTSLGRGIEQHERNFFANTLVAYLQIGTETLTRYSRKNQYVHFDTTKRERGATLERAQAGALGMNSGFFMADEVRDWFDLPALPNGDGQQTYIPINTQLLEMALLTLEDAENGPPGALIGVPTTNGGPPSTDSGSPPRGSTPVLHGKKPPRKNAPAVTPRRSENGNGNGHHDGMTVEEARQVVRAALPSSLADRVLYREPRSQPVEFHINLDQPISIAQGEPQTHIEVAPAPASEVRFSPLIEVAPAAVTVPVNVASPDVRVEQPKIEVNVPTPEVHVGSPEVRVEVAAAEVNIPTPEIHVEVPQVAAPEVHVDVAAPEVNVTPHFDSPPAPDVHVDVSAPNVNVAAPEVNVSAPEVHVEPRFEAPRAPNVTVKPQINVPEQRRSQSARRVERDEHGRIIRVIDEDE